MTEYAFVDDAGVERLRGTIDPAPGGSLPDPFVVTGTDPDSQTARIIGAPAQVQNLLQIETATSTLLAVGPPGGSGLQYGPNPDNDTAYHFLDNGDAVFQDGDGDEYFHYNSQASVKNLDLDPENGQVTVLAGVLRLAAGSEPPDAALFNGSFAFYRDGNALKAKAKIDGDFVHLTLGTFA